MIQLIIYDLDGTLIDSRLDIVDSVNWMLRELGVAELSAEQISSFVGEGLKNMIQRALKESARNNPLPPLERGVKLYRRHYEEHLLDHTRLYPSVRKVLEFFKDRKQAVVTNKPEDFSLKILQGLGVESYFLRILGGGGGFPKKPAPEPLFEILRGAGVSAQESILVGDSPIDVETGRNAGIKTFAVTYGFGKREALEKARPDFMLEDLAELTPCPLLRN